jgi:hypothetical protein
MNGYGFLQQQMKTVSLHHKSLPVKDIFIHKFKINA